MLMLGGGASNRPADGRGGLKLDLTAKMRMRQERRGEERRTDSPVNGKSSSIVPPVCFGASVFCEPDVFHVNILSDTGAGGQQAKRNFEEQRKKGKVVCSRFHRGRPDGGRGGIGQRRRRQTAPHTIGKARFREEGMRQVTEHR